MGVGDEVGVDMVDMQENFRDATEVSNFALLS